MISTSFFSKAKGDLSQVMSKGFTLVEVLVSLGIMVSIMSVVLSNQNTYTESTSLTNTADEISLMLSQAQVYGVSVREFSPGSENFNVSYGLSFNNTYKDSYIFFADKDEDGRYDSGWSCPQDPSSECISKHTISKTNSINRIGYIRTNEQESWSVGGVDITFLRPNTEAVIKFFNSAGVNISVTSLKEARIELRSVSGLFQTIHVNPAGQISIQ